MNSTMKGHRSKMKQKRISAGVLALFGLLAVAATSASARQSVGGPDLSPYGILNNSVANLHASGGVIWAGPFLSNSADGGASWYVPDSDSLFGTVNRLFSIDVEGDVIVAGLGRADRSGGESIQTASGFLVSIDGGQSFQYRFPQLDGPEADTQEYGVSILPALPVIVPQQSPPFDVDYDAATEVLYVAGWASGLRRSLDYGRNWERVVLPPDNLDAISPDQPYSFSLEPQRGSNGSLNHMGFSVLVASDGTVWAGTAGGLNKSTDGGVGWQKFKADGTSSSLTGDWIISIEEQEMGSGSVIWTATWNTGESGGGTGQFGVSFTSNGGQSFEQTLLGERIYDFAFDGNRVYAAGDGGLFMTDDGGRTWNSVNQFRDRTQPSRLVRQGSEVFSVEVDDGILWVGTSDGLLRSDDEAASWTLFRVDVPLHPDEPSSLAPDVDAFAYPNPFSPGEDRYVRIKYETGSMQNIEIRIFDFGMNTVRTLRESGVDGVAESLWDGTDSRGMQVANGAYFYEIRAGSDRFRGKILVIE